MFTTAAKTQKSYCPPNRLRRIGIACCNRITHYYYYYYNNEQLSVGIENTSRFGNVDFQ